MYNWDKHWQGHILPFCKVEAEKGFLDQPFINKDCMILDVGCGDGAATYILSRKGCENYTGIDISRRTIVNMKSRYPDNYFERMDAENMMFRNKIFDITFAYGVLEYIDAKKAFEEMVRVTKPGGWIGVWVSNYGQWLYYLPFKRLLAYLIIPFLGLLNTNSGISLKNSTWRQCHEIVMVNIGPKRNKVNILDFYDKRFQTVWTSNYIWGQLR